MAVFVMLYRHRHGEDISVFGKEDDAIRSAATIAMDYRNEIPDPEHRGRLQDLFMQDKHGECVQLYNDVREGDESLEIHGPLEVR